MQSVSKCPRFFLFAALSLVLAEAAPAQVGRAAAGSAEFTVRHAPVGEVQGRVQEHLLQLRLPGEIRIDSRRNVLEVAGPPETLRAVTEFLQSLERAGSPTDAAALLAANTPPVVRGYPMAEEHMESAAAQWRARWGAHPDVRVSVDRGTGQVFVLAPEEVHRAIAAAPLPGAAPSAPARTQPQPSPQPSPLRPLTPASYQEPAPENGAGGDTLALRGVSARELEASLSGLLGRAAEAHAAPGAETAHYRVAGPGGEEVQIRIDRRRNEVAFSGSPRGTGVWRRIIGSLDRPAERAGEEARLVSLGGAQPGSVRRAVDLLHWAKQAPGGGEVELHWRRPEEPLRWGGDLAARIFRQREEAVAQANQNLQPGPGGELPGNGGAPAGAEDPEAGGPIGPVQLEFVEGLDIIIVRGARRDVERVLKIIEEIEQQTAETEPAIEIHPLQHVDGAALAELVTQLYDEILSPRRGRVSITALGKPNALLLIGRRESVETVIDLVRKLDQPVLPSTQFRVFQLRFKSAAELEQMLTTFYEERGSLGVRVRVVSDFRSNSVIVQAGPRDLAEVARLVEQVDVGESQSRNELRVFRLKNSLAEELAQVLQQAIAGQVGTGVTPGQQPPAGANQQLRSAMLSFMTIDADGKRLFRSGILSDVRVTADVRANALLVSAPLEAMDLLAALIDRLDALPSAEAQIKVFTIINGDATRLAETLQQLFGQQQQQQNQPGLQSASLSGESSLVPLRFAVEARTNSIIASGTAGDLQVIEALLLRLDSDDVRDRETTVYRLRHAPAIDVALAINDFLTGQRQVQQIAPDAVSPFEQLEREVVVVPEPVSNSLIVSATPRYFQEIQRIVEELDAQPPMVLIQVLIAEVRLGDARELGMEFGLQDSLLFDRGVVVDGQTNPGFNFNNQPLGNSSSPASLATRGSLAGQALSSFGVGRTNSSLGYGGLVLSAASESISMLIRALEDQQRVRVLSRPQVMTLDNQPAFVQVGQRVPRITNTQVTQTGTVNSIDLDNVGILLGVTPRISPEGLVVMEIDAERSAVGEESEGIPVSINQNGDVIRQPRIDTSTAQTTVSARSGQTVIIGGLITNRNANVERKIPYLGDVPVLGNMFRFNSSIEERSELLIIMTPHVVREEGDSDFLLQMEADRMSWCLADVAAIHGHAPAGTGLGVWGHDPTPIVYPDLNPTGDAPRGLLESLPPGPTAPLPQPGSSRLQPTPAAPLTPAGTGEAAPAGAWTPPLREARPMEPFGGERPEGRYPVAPAGYVPPRPRY